MHPRDIGHTVKSARKRRARVCASQLGAASLTQNVYPCHIAGFGYLGSRVAAACFPASLCARADGSIQELRRCCRSGPHKTMVCRGCRVLSRQGDSPRAKARRTLPISRQQSRTAGGRRGTQTSLFSVFRSLWPPQARSASRATVVASERARGPMLLTVLLQTSSPLLRRQLRQPFAPRVTRIVRPFWNSARANYRRHRQPVDRAARHPRQSRSPSPLRCSLRPRSRTRSHSLLGLRSASLVKATVAGTEATQKGSCCGLQGPHPLLREHSRARRRSARRLRPPASSRLARACQG